MLALKKSITYIAKSRWYVVGAIALTLVAANGPGQVITLVADCYWKTSWEGPVQRTTTQTDLIVRAPASTGRPVYLTNVPPGPVPGIAVGMLVRTYAWDGDQVVLVDGTLTQDGRVFANGKALERAFGPNG